LQNYLQIATGDFDGDKLDEVAVYIPEQGNSRLAIYKLQTTEYSDANLYLDSSKWSLAWTYAFYESPYVSNMVSITTGDFNREGTDDIALTWGTYYGPEYNTPCKAAVLYGGKDSNMLQDSKSISLSYSNSEIVRAAFTYGDIDGNSTDELILGGQLVSDINNKVASTRVIMMYSYDGEDDEFDLYYSNNFKVIADKDDNGKYPAGEDGLYWSTPACVANIAAVKMDGIGKAACIYFDSVLYKYGSNGLEIMTGGELDEVNGMKDTRVGANGTTHPYYAEYGIESGDFNGDGKDTIQVMQYFLPYSKTYSLSSGWWFWEENWTETDVLDGKFMMLGIYSDGTGLGFKSKDYGKQCNSYYCTVNTDEDTCYMEYTGEHYINYSDPKVLAVLASAPYFADVATPGDNSGYMEASTEYTSSSGSSTGESSSDTLSIGAYVSFEHDFEVFGVKVASMEAEVAYTHGFTWETENTSTLEQSVSYGTDVGQDAVAFYSIPMEVYVYKSYNPVIDSNNNITYEEQLMTVNIPHTAAVVTMPLSKYEDIAADYDDLPQIAGNILNHTVGNPATYPSSPADFSLGLDNNSSSESNAIVYNGDWAGVSYGDFGYVGQEIAMSNETSNSFSNSDSIDTKLGAGVGDFKVGVTAGYEYGYGSCTVNTSGSSFSGTVYNLPAGTEEYSYYYAWKLFAFLYNDGKNSFPIVDYLIKDVTTPPNLPEDFAQDTSRTTDSQNCLTWSYDGGAVAGFQLYRYYEFPDGSGSYELGPIIKSSDYERIEKTANTRYYSYIDQGLDPYTDYDYQIQAIGTAQPTDSILSTVVTARIKTETGYPDIQLDKTEILVYPDKNSSVTAYIANSELYTQGAKFQWQKLIDGIWTDISGATKATFTISSAGLADEGDYRCRVNVIYDSYYISAYSESVSVDYAKRNSTISKIAIEEQTSTGPKLTVQVGHSYTDISTIPTGTVTFEINSTNYSKSYTSEIGINGYASVATTELPVGVYEITAYYSGSRVFKSATSDKEAYLSGSNEGYLLQVYENNIYGESVSFELNKVSKSEGQTIFGPAGDIVNYKITKDVETLTYETYSIFTIPVWKTVSVEQTNWVNGSIITAKEAGTFNLIASENGVEIASKNFTIAKRNITIDATDKNVTAKTDAAKHPTVADDLSITSGSLASGDSIDKLGLYVKATDTAGKEITISSSTDPGNYTIVGSVSSYNSTLSNYNVTFLEGIYTLTGETFTVNGIAAQLLGRDVGIIEVLSPINHNYWNTQYQNGTQIIFTATPNTGYTIAEWYIMDNSTKEYVAQNNTSNKLNYTMKSEPLSVKVEFEVKGNTFTYKVKDDDSNLTGSVLCTNADSLQSGAIVIENASYDFKAVPAAGYHFAEWQKYVYGSGTTYPTGSVDELGNNTISITMGNNSAILYAAFERDSYAIDLGKNLEAWYMDNLDNDTSTPDVKVTVQSGSLIKGDKEVTVQPVTGFIVSSEAVWYKDSLAIENSTGLQSYKFNITAATSIDVETLNKPSKIDFSISNAGGNENTVDIEINDKTVSDTAALVTIEGGSKVSLTAVPSYGYLFDKWIINGIDDYSSGSTLIISALGDDVAIVAVFKGNEDHTINVSYDTQGDHGSLSYMLNGGEKINLASTAAIKVFEGDEIVLTASVDPDFMIGKWIIDGKEYQMSSKTWTLSDIVSDHDVNVEFTPMAYYTVNYSAGTDGEISATMDDISFISGNKNIGGGTKIIFTAVPDSGMMVDYWTLNGKVITNEYGTYIADEYTIDALSYNSTVEVYFRNIVEYTVSTATTNAAISAKYDPSDYEYKSGDYTYILEGTTAIFTIAPKEGYMISDANATGNAGIKGLNGFDSITQNDDGTWTCIIKMVNDNILVSASAEKVYNIVTSNIAGGNVVLSTNTALEGDGITITAYPSTNYKFTEWTVTYIDATTGSGITAKVAVSDPSVSPATFTMPSGDVTVTPLFTYSPPSDPIEEEGNGGGGGGGGSVAVITYTITSKAGDGGSISPESAEVENGEDQTFEITPDTGYKISDVLVDGKSIGSVSSYTFEEVYSDAAIEAVFAKMSYAKFIDVNETDWFFGAANFVVENGLFKGTSDSTFSPNMTMTRGMFVTVIGRLFENMKGVKVESDDDIVLTDVSSAQYYATNVKWAIKNEIVNGYSETEFRPDTEITREQIAAIMYRYSQFAGIDISNESDISTFKDSSDVDDWALDAMRWAVDTDLIKGRPDGSLDPKGNVLRSEVAAIMQRFYEKIK